MTSMDDGTGGGLYLLIEGPIVVQHVVVPLGVAPERCTGQHRATRPDQHRGGAALSFSCHSLALVQQNDSQIMVSGMPDTQMQRQPWFMGTHAVSKPAATWELRMRKLSPQRRWSAAAQPG